MQNFTARALCTLPLLIGGCAGPIVETPPPRTARVAIDEGTTAFVARIRLRSDGRGDVPMRRVDRYLLQVIEETGLRALREEDSGRQIAAGAFVIRVDIERWTDDFHQEGVFVFCGIMAGITLGLGWLPCAGARNATDHTLEVSVRVYDAAGAATRRVAEDGNGEIESRIDTSDRSPLFSRDYTVRLRTAAGPQGVSGADFEVFSDAFDRRLAELLWDAASVDVADAIRGARADRLPVAQQSAGSSPP